MMKCCPADREAVFNLPSVKWSRSTRSSRCLVEAVVSPLMSNVTNQIDGEAGFELLGRGPVSV
jgi:hypothetical protein